MPAIVVWIGAIISRIFATRLGGWVASVMVFLGLSWATNEVSMVGIRALISSHIAGVGGAGLEWLVFFNVPAYLSLIVSAYSAATVKRAFLVKRT